MKPIKIKDEFYESLKQIAGETGGRIDDIVNEWMVHFLTFRAFKTVNEPQLIQELQELETWEDKEKAAARAEEIMSVTTNFFTKNIYQQYLKTKDQLTKSEPEEVNNNA